MRKIEQKTPFRPRRTKLQKAILSSVAIAGVLSLGLVAPNVILALDKLGYIPRKRDKDIILNAASRLRKKGFLRVENKHYVLTHEGEKTLRRWMLSEPSETPDEWDGKWRVVIFDIPEKKKVLRDEVRRIFIERGFRRLQDSVWIYPYDSEEIIELLRTDLGLRKNLIYMIVDKIEHESELMSFFDLPICV